MKNIILVLAFTIFLNSIGKSQDQAVVFVNTIYSEKTVNKITENYKSYFKQIAISVYENEKDSNFISYMNYAIDNTKSMMKSMVMNDLVPIYKKVFTNEEFAELNKFYGSKLGQKYLERTTDISKDVQNLIIAKYMPTIKADLEKYLETHKK